MTKKATETQTGVKTFTCTGCKATRTETIPKLNPTTPKVSGTSMAKVKAGKKSLTISWTKVKGAAGYDIFFAKCNHGKKEIKCKKVRTIKAGKTFKVKATVIKANKKKKLMSKKYAPTLRYMTTDKKVATVSKSGKITAKGKGTCTIIVYAHNGVSKNIKVTVK